MPKRQNTDFIESHDKPIQRNETCLAIRDHEFSQFPVDAWTDQWVSDQIVGG